MNVLEEKDKEKDQAFIFSRSKLYLVMSISSKQYELILNDLEAYLSSSTFSE